MAGCPPLHADAIAVYRFGGHVDGKAKPTVDRGDRKGVNLRPGVLDVPGFLYYGNLESVETPGQKMD